MGGIQCQDFPLGAAQLQPCSLHGLDALLPEGTLPPPGQADYLHGEGAASAYHMAGTGIVDGRPQQRCRVHAGMPPERAVLELHQCRGVAFRHRVGRGEAPLLIGRNPGSQELSLCTFHHGGIAYTFEKFPRQTEKPGQQQDTCHCHPHPPPGKMIHVHKCTESS